MALGIEPNSIAPGLIMQSGKMLSDNIRDIGKQVQASIYEVNTQKDLAAMAQEIQNGAVIPQSEDFAQQAVAFGFRHPLAIQDPRGQMALNVLGKAHGEWRQQQTLQSRLTNQLTGIEARNQSALGQIAARLEGQKEMAGLNQQGRTELENLRQKNRLEVQGLKNEAAATPKPMTKYQEATLGFKERGEKRAQLKTQLDVFEKDIQKLKSSIEKVNTAELRGDFKDNPDAPKAQAERLQWQKKLEATLELRNAVIEEMSKIGAPTEEPAVEPELGAAPPVAPQGDGVEPELGAAPPVAPQGDGVLPTPQDVPPQADTRKKVRVFDPNGKPVQVLESQLESALANGFRRR